MSGQTQAGPHVVAVIPARWESTRLPGKVLAPLAGRPVLAWVIDAARGARRIDEVLEFALEGGHPGEHKDIVTQAGGATA